MLEINCPYCGKRAQKEFTYAGDAGADRAAHQVDGVVVGAAADAAADRGAQELDEVGARVAVHIGHRAGAGVQVDDVVAGRGGVPAVAPPCGPHPLARQTVSGFGR